MPEVLALIPARGGSKGVPKKNILPLAGHPLIAYSIKAALEATSINRVIVSTDSPEIGGISRAYGADVPFYRPESIASDKSTDYEFIKHALSWLQTNESYEPEIIVQMRPTSPIRLVEDIDSSINALISSQADSLRIVIPSPYTPYKMWFVNNGQLKPILELDGVKEPYNSPRQILPNTYWQVGILDVIRTSTILQKKSVTGDHIMPYIVEPDYAIDIDTMESFEKAERILQKIDCVKF